MLVKSYERCDWWCVRAKAMAIAFEYAVCSYMAMEVHAIDTSRFAFPKLYHYPYRISNGVARGAHPGPRFRRGERQHSQSSPLTSDQSPQTTNTTPTHMVPSPSRDEEIIKIIEIREHYISNFESNKSMNYSAIFAIFVAILACTDAQNLRKKKRRSRESLITAGKADSAMFKALTVNYPLHLFSGNAPDWRTKAKYSKKLVEDSETSRLWSEVSYAQDQEDVWLYENWFYGMEKGLIMESGALNGILFSTSFMFEKFANWTALHVEADPENYGNLKLNREKAVNVHGALCSEPRLLHYSSVGVVPVRGFIEFMTPSFMKKWHGKVYNNKTKIEDLPTVQCLPVKALLRELNVKHVDIWILDTEGAEESVLKGTDFQEVRFNAVAMECDEHDTEKNERKTKILESNGFKCTLIERNCMCKHNSYMPSTAPAKSILRKWDGQKWSKTYQQ